MPVVEAQANYKASARYDDEVLVRIRASKIGKSSVSFENEVTKLPAKELLCTGHTVHVVVGEDGKPMPIPERHQGEAFVLVVEGEPHS